MDQTPGVERLSAEHRSEVESVLCEAFARYPVMRFVLGAASPAGERLRLLVSLFVAGRWMRGHPMLGVRDSDGALLAVATLTPPGAHPTPPELTALRASTWHVLGEEARLRYEAFADAASALEPAGRLWHVNMLGVRTACRGNGLGARLLREVERIATADASAEGIGLSTEDPANLRYYQAHGFRIGGLQAVGPGLDTWALWRPLA